MPDLRIVMDPGVLVAALIAPAGPPAALVRAVRSDRLELVVSPLLLGELAGVLSREKFRRYVTTEEAHEFVDGIARLAITVQDPTAGPRLTRDPGDDYLVRLTVASGAEALVSGDRDLVDADLTVEVVSPRSLISRLDAS